MTVDDVPVGQAYKIIDYWGGSQQHKRWHMTSPVELNPSRNGDPFFMDENMIAFGVSWKDGTKVQEAFLGLMNLFADGVNGEGIVAHPLEVKVTRLNQA